MEAKSVKKRLQKAVEILAAFLGGPRRDFSGFSWNFGCGRTLKMRVWCRRRAYFEKIRVLKGVWLRVRFFSDFVGFWESFWGGFGDKSGVGF